MCAIRGWLCYGVAAVPEEIPEFGGACPAGKAAGKPDDGNCPVVELIGCLLRLFIPDRLFQVLRCIV
ncbi:hypothetical protein GCM10010398_71400 [Streptomyces fimbriatus]